MADTFVNFTFDSDPDRLVDLWIEYLQSVVPEFETYPGHFDYILTQGWARIASEVMEVAANVPLEIFRYFGAELAGLPPNDATRATGNSTWVAVNNAGYTIPSGSLVAVQAAGDVTVLFETVEEVVIPPGSTSTAAGEVQLVALEEGEIGNGLTGAATTTDPLAFVASITIVGTTSGGQSEETTSDYLDRLKAQLALQAPRPIIPRDFEVMARSVAGVERALALDGYNPANSTFNNERMITVVPIDAVGQPMSVGKKNEVDALLQANREVNFIVHVIDPTYTQIDVAFTGKCYEGYDPATVQANVIAAITAYLNPASWGKPRLAENERVWIKEDKVRYLEVASAINSVEGFHYIQTLTVQLGTTDVTLTGAAPLPTPDSITGTVTGP